MQRSLYFSAPLPDDFAIADECYRIAKPLDPSVIGQLAQLATSGLRFPWQQRRTTVCEKDPDAKLVLIALAGIARSGLLARCSQRKLAEIADLRRQRVASALERLCAVDENGEHVSVLRCIKGSGKGQRVYQIVAPPDLAERR